MGRAWIRAKLESEKIKVVDYGEYWKNDGRPLIPTGDGVHCLFYGNALQYLGRSANLRERLWQHIDNKMSRIDNRILFGNYSWYVLHLKQIPEAEDFLIRYYDPPCNIINGKRRE